MTQPTQAWLPKDPDARMDYLYSIPLDALDSVASYLLTLVSGTAVIDAQSLAAAPSLRDDGTLGQDVTIWIDDGTAGETNIFHIQWVTTAGREDDANLLLPIVANDSAPLTLTGYAKPSAFNLQQRYPEFIDVSTVQIAYWLTDGERYVTTAWVEGDYAAGMMAIAAHNMALNGLGAQSESTTDLPPGITSMKIGTLGLAFDSALTREKAQGTWGATKYGLEYLRLRRINRGGPRVMGTGYLPYDPLRYPQGEA